MRLFQRHIIVLCLVFITPSLFAPLLAQDRCGTVAYSKTLQGDNALYQPRFEEWLQQKMLAPRLSGQSRQQAAPYQVPVVIHVIHNGEPTGAGTNISEAQIASQIRVLNADFQRRNSDAINTPPEFAAVAGSLDIEFVLARQDPEGQATTGIVRVNGGRSSWTMNDNYTLKSLSYWPAEQYLNIWVCNLTSHLGYAQFPESDLPGLENSSTNRLTDGIVIWYRSFGSIDDGAFNLDARFNKGRTTTHETGHFFGLNHIWGDDSGCEQSDYVNDTPNQGTQTSGCPIHPKGDNCSEVIMFQNFLDYSDDNCMNLFTQGQVNRMVAVIENSPRRNSLLTSAGLQDPHPASNDLGIREIVFPDASVCTNQITPVIEVRNYGSNPVSSARIRFMLDGVAREIKDFALNLGLFESTQVSFTALTIPSGTHEIAFTILLTNGGTDGGTYNDQKTATAIIPAFGDIPFTESFNIPPQGWITHNPDGQITWTIVDTPGGISGNKALKLNYYDYEDKVGEVDVFLSPIFDLTGVPAATLTFDVAHARYQTSNDRLQLAVLTDCDVYSEGTLVYDKAGDALKTTMATTAPFMPGTADHWRHEFVDLSAFIGVKRVQIAFIGINDWGNNIYLDNIALFNEARRDIALERLVTPALVTCEKTIAPRIAIRNAGNTPWNAVDVQYTLNGGPLQSLSVSNLNLSGGVEKQVDLTTVGLVEGANTLSVGLSDTNGDPDMNPQNNSAEFTIIVNTNEDRIPLRQDFEDPFTPAWTAANPTGSLNWEIIKTNFGQSLYLNAFNNSQPGSEAWLVSPVLDFSHTNEAAMSFDLSYAADEKTAPQTLRIMASTDCGLSYKEVAYNFPSPYTLGGDQTPDDDGDWHKDVAVDLSTLAGNENVRIAFVVRDDNGNNLFLDNIEFFLSATPPAIEIDDLYTVYGYDLSNPASSELSIAFNLPERQPVRYSVISATGQMETDGIIADVLNQTFPLNLSARLQPGVYFIRLQIGKRYYTSKILIF